MMITLFKKIVQWKLKFLTSIYLSIKGIEIIAITGSAGKTTAKRTIGQIIPETTVFIPKEAYNTEYGLPLAVFGEQVPATTGSLSAWTALIFRMFIKIFKVSPYKRIVLEYGADKVGDISYLTSFAKPHIALVTTVLPVHLEGFESIKAIALEKEKLVKGLCENDFAVLNFDNPLVKKMAKNTKARVISFGAKSSDITYSALKYNESGMAFDVKWKDTKYAINLPVVAPQLLPSYLGAFAVGLLLGEDPKGLVKKLSHITSEKGRMNVLAGIGGSIIIDDTYNSNPESAKAALDVLSKYPGRKIAVLGSMNELGDFTKEGHAQIGKAASEVADEVLVVGDIAGQHLYPVVLEKMNKNIVHKFANATEAGEYLKPKVKKGDVLLFKGSQNGVFLEEAVKYVLSDPDKATDLLVRQDQMWQKKKGKL